MASNAPLESCCSASACAVSEREEPRKGEQQRSRHRFLMCPPTHFAVRYVINAWMSLDAQPEPTLALRQWEDLRATIEKCGAEVCGRGIAAAGRRRPACELLLYTVLRVRSRPN